jgi:hypothetical protein
VFTVITAGTRTGFFANTNIADASSVVYFIPAYGDNYASLTAKLRSALHIPVETIGRRLDHGTFSFQFAGTPGINYFVDGSTNLVDWVRVGIINADAAMVTFQDSGAISNACRFYRVFSDQ